MKESKEIMIVEKEAIQTVMIERLKDNKVVLNQNIISIEAYLNSQLESDSQEDFFKASCLIESSREKQGLLSGILAYPDTVNQFMMFIHRMSDEGWKLDDLPVETAKEKAIKELLEEVLPNINQRTKQWESVLSQPSLSNVKIYESFFPYAIDQRIQSMVKNGAVIEELEPKKSCLSLMAAANPRYEALACIQHMLQDKMSYHDQIIVALDSGLLEQIERYCIQFKIPYQRVVSTDHNASYQLMQAIIEFNIDPNLETLTKIIRNDGIKLQHGLKLMQYMDTFQPDIDTLFQPFHHVTDVLNKSVLNDVLSASNYLKLEKQAEQAFQLIRDLVLRIIKLNRQDFKAWMSSIFDIYVELQKDIDENEAHCIQQVKKCFETGEPYLSQMKDPIPTLLYGLGQLTTRHPEKNGVILTDLKHAFIPYKKRLYLLGANADNFPQYENHTGLFDDDYFRGIKGYDNQTRYDYHMQKVEKIFGLCDETIVSYSMGTYEGKTRKLAVELELKFKKVNIEKQLWPIVFTERNVKDNQYQLNPEISNKLYFADGSLKGSVTSFERYFKCPYQYYLHSGLSIRKPDEVKINNQIIGNIMHRIFELSILKAGKKYYEELITKIDNYTDPYFLELAKLFPKDTSEIQRISSRVKQSIRLSLDFLNDRENSTPFEPFAVEQKFDLVVNVGAAYPIHLNGKIDRIDRNENGFLVIDYKSSEKQLQEKKVVIGTQLQLPTYLFLGNAHLNFGYPYGSYFFSLNPKSIPQPGFKHYQSALCAVEAFIEPKALLKSRRLIGWTLDKITIMDPPGTHTSNVYFYGEPRVRPEYDPDKVYLKMIQLYKDMVHGIKDGNISKHNLDRSCEFCDFEHFCHFSGEEEKINKVPAELSLIKEKGVE